MTTGTVQRADGAMNKKAYEVSWQDVHDLPQEPYQRRGSRRSETARFSANTLSVIDEARRISRDKGIRGYSSMADLKAALPSLTVLHQKNSV